MAGRRLERPFWHKRSGTYQHFPTTNQFSVVLDRSASTSPSGSLKYLFMVVPGGLQPALLQTPTDPMATVVFVSGAGVYLVQLIVTDASGNTSKSGVVTLTYQP